MSVLKVKDDNNSWVPLPAGGVGVPSGGTREQVLIKYSAADYATGWEDVDNILPQWTLAGTTSDASVAVVYPTTAKELLILANVSSSGFSSQYSAVFLVSAISDRQSLMVGGYYYGSGDYGIANLTHNISSHSLAFRNLRYGSGTTGTFYIYYR